jgi:hypothetical protein
MQRRRVSLAQSKELVYSSFRLHQCGLVPIGTPTFEDWRSCGLFLCQVEASVHFWLGDWLLYGEREWGHEYEHVTCQITWHERLPIGIKAARP